MKLSPISSDKIVSLKEKALIARAAILKATTLAGSGHPGGSMSTIDILLTLYEMLNIKPDNFQREDRDRVVVSNGHVSPGVYAALASNNFMPMEDFISQFRLCGSIFEGHIERSVPGVEWGTGNLGQGLSAGCGFALASKIKGLPYKVIVMMGDGEQQKGQLSEARRFAAKYKLDKLTAIVDYNRLQISGKINDIMPQNIKENYLSDGWHVLEIDGHSFTEISNSIIEASAIDKPVMILARTVMGKGVSFMENKEKYHGAAISEEQLTEALRELGFENDIEIYKELRRAYQPLTSCDLRDTQNYKLKAGEAILYEKPLDNRSAWGNAIADLAKINKKEPYTPLLVFDCDLQGSVKTNDFEKELPQNFFQCGIMEHHTATMSGAISLEGFQTFFADFGVFGVDETYNQHRLNDINHTNLKAIVTHVGLDVGEDGKTHQCLDYLALMRNLYHFRPIIPVCPNQTDRVIRYLIDKKGNYLVAMGRSKVPIITKEDGSPYYDEQYRFEYGIADIIRDGNDGALLTMGTLAGKALEVVDRLSEKDIHLQLWAISCPTAIDNICLQKAASTGLIFTYEDHNVNSGLGSIVADKLMESNLNPKLVKFGVTDYALSGKSEDVLRYAGLDPVTITGRIKNDLIASS
ncbi:MAG: transketolase [Candidatus Cloacimonetes bacterium]|nr:transketolase [Candidatus Cloacimonadota bacterium]